MVHHSGTEHIHLSWIGKNSHFYPKKQKNWHLSKFRWPCCFFLFFKRNSFCQNKISKLNFQGVKIWPKKTFLKPKILFLGIENDLFFPFFWRGALWQRSWSPSLTLKNVKVLFTTSLKIRLKNITLVIFNLNSLFSIPPHPPTHTQIW